MRSREPEVRFLIRIYFSLIDWRHDELLPVLDLLMFLSQARESKGAGAEEQTPGLHFLVFVPILTLFHNL